MLFYGSRAIFYVSQPIFWDHKFVVVLTICMAMARNLLIGTLRTRNTCLACNTRNTREKVILVCASREDIDSLQIPLIICVAVCVLIIVRDVFQMAIGNACDCMARHGQLSISAIYWMGNGHYARASQMRQIDDTEQNNKTHSKSITKNGNLHQ